MEREAFARGRAGDSTGGGCDGPDHIDGLCARSLQDAVAWILHTVSTAAWG